MRLPLLLLALIPMSGAAAQSPSTRPSEAPAGKGFVAIAAGAYHSLALRGDGSLVAWGWNDYGQTDVPEGDDFVAIAAGHFHSLALRRDGSLAMWGVNPIGQFLDPDARLQEPAGGDFIGVAASNSNRYEYHSLALRADGTVAAWGMNRYGQIDVPAGAADAIAVSAGGRHSVVLRRDGSLFSWGWDSAVESTPAGDDFVALSSGAYHTLALRKDGSIAAWGGDEHGQIEVPDCGEVVAVAAGKYHSLALRADGSVACWGHSQWGQCESAPVDDLVAIDAGGWHNLGLRRDGSIVQWGRVPPQWTFREVPRWRQPPPQTAVQTVYRNGVPHTDRQGRVMTEYDPDRSFLPIGIYGVGLDSDFASLKAAHFNTITHIWISPKDLYPLAREHGLQVLITGRGKGDHWVSHGEFVDRSHVLAQYTIDEPYVFTGGSGRTSDDPVDEIQRGWRDVYDSNREALHRVFPGMPTYVNMSPEIDAPRYGWGDWLRRSDIACLDNYPFKHRGVRVSELSSDTIGIPRMVWAAATATDEAKPVWMILPGFEQANPDAPWYFRFPAPEELRAAAWASVIHGATGIIYWTWDHRAWRATRIIGMHADPQPHPDLPGSASPLKRLQSKAVWETAAQFNAELAELKPVILSPTVGPEIDYSVRITKGSMRTPADIRALLKPHPEGGFVLLTVNIDEAVLNAEWTFPRELARVHAMFENGRENLLPDGEGGEGANSFSVHYQPYAAHIFRVVMKDG